MGLTKTENFTNEQNELAIIIKALGPSCQDCYCGLPTES